MIAAPWEEPDHVRTAGVLEVRPHLRPKPVKRDFTWFYSRDDYGLLRIDPIPTDLALDMTVEGEA
jgi:hypothetical protein